MAGPGLREHRLWRGVQRVARLNGAADLSPRNECERESWRAHTPSFNGAADLNPRKGDALSKKYREGLATPTRRDDPFRLVRI